LELPDDRMANPRSIRQSGNPKIRQFLITSVIAEINPASPLFSRVL
jgi:hypothetical protein